MFLTENGSNDWKKMLVENFNVSDQEKLKWVSEYAAIHEIHESQIGVNAMPTGTTGYVPTQGVGPVYATPLNTTGMGSVHVPMYNNPASTVNVAGQPMGQFNAQTPGSGDLPVSTLPMALNVALLTIGLELVPVIPTKSPLTVLSYMDFPYAGGKLGRLNETSFDGKGAGKENKPIYIKVLGDLQNLSDAVTALKAAAKAKQASGTTLAEKQLEVKVAGEDATFVGIFKGVGRNDGGILLETKYCTVDGNEGGEAASITQVFKGDSVTLTPGGELALAKADFVQTSADFIDGFANFYDGGNYPMTRGENETGTGNTIGLRLFNKWVQVGSYEVTGTVTRQQLQDLPMFGVDAVGKVMEAMQNEITQTINARILERVFALGVSNAVQQKAFQNVDLNLFLGQTGTTKDLKDFGVKPFIDANGIDRTEVFNGIKNSEVLTSAENTHTRQRRISSRVLAAAALIQSVGRRGPATWVVTNSQIVAALQDVAGYVVCPMDNTLKQGGNLYQAGTLMGLKVYCDPYMTWDDTRICIGRKGDGNSPGVIFMPYILADTVSITAEGTMAPKMLVNSRYALVDAGFYPELQYFTFAVNNDFGIL